MSTVPPGPPAQPSVPAGPGHPAPARHAVSSGRLFFGFFGGPAAWSIQLLAGYTLVEWRCAPRLPGAPVPPLGPTGTALLLVGAAAIGVALTALVVAFSIWRSSAREVHGGVVHALDAGEGRTRFMALAGVAMSALFLVACVVTLAAALLLPACR